MSNQTKYTLESLREMVYSFQKSRIFLTAYELGIFTTLDSSEKTAEKISHEIESDHEATCRLLNALVAIGLLYKNDGKFRNSEFANQYLVKGKTDWLSGFYHTNNMWNVWSSLTNVVKNGNIIVNERLKNRSPEVSQAFIDAMHSRAAKTASMVVENLDLSGINTVLDVGGGSGVYSMAFVKAKPEINAVVFDLEGIIPITKEYIKNEGFNQNIKTQTGDYHFDKFIGTYDLIFLSAIVHINSYAENLELIKKCFDSLNNGGQIVIQDHIMNEDRTQPTAGAIFALNMLVGTNSGNTYTETEMKEWLANCGITEMVRIEIPGISSMIVGRKS